MKRNLVSPQNSMLPPTGDRSEQMIQMSHTSSVRSIPDETERLNEKLKSKKNE